MFHRINIELTLSQRKTIEQSINQRIENEPKKRIKVNPSSRRNVTSTTTTTTSSSSHSSTTTSNKEQRTKPHISTINTNLNEDTEEFKTEGIAGGLSIADYDLDGNLDPSLVSALTDICHSLSSVNEYIAAQRNAFQLAETLNQNPGQHQQRKTPRSPNETPPNQGIYVSPPRPKPCPGPLKVGSPSVPPNASPSTSVGTTTTPTNTTGSPSVSESCNQTSIQLLLQMMWYSHQKGRWSHSSMKADR